MIPFVSHNHLKCLTVASWHSLILSKRFSDKVNPFGTVRHVNPFKKKKRPPIGIPNESRIANRICLTVIGNGGPGQPRCIGLFTDLKSYFFNCGEGVGRFCREYDINMCMVKHIFVTQKKWHNLSGISDIVLTNQTFGVYQLTLHGPPGIEHYKSIIITEKDPLGIRIRRPEDKFFIDHSLQIDYVPIRSQPMQSVPTKRGQKVKAANQDLTVSYICKIFEKPGDFLVEKCVEYGVPLGPELLKLKNFENLVLPSGKTVYPEDVHTPPYPGTVILVVDCPSEDFLDSFTNEDRFKTYQLPHSSSSEVSIVFHFTPPHIFNSAKYQDWIHRFHQETQHYVLNSENCIRGSLAIHKTLKYFHMLDNQIFVELKDGKKSNSFVSTTNGNVFHPPPMLQLHLRPEKKLSWTNVVNLEKGIEEDGTEAAKESPEFYCKLDELKETLSKFSWKSSASDFYPEVVFLGTSSSTSTAYRNVTAILVNTSADQSIVLDCGEGTVMQLTRYSGPNDVHKLLRKISCIFVSHMHSDHYMGLFHLLSQRMDAFKILGIPYEPVAVVLPFPVENVLKKFCEIFEDFSKVVRIFSCNYLVKERGNSLRPFLGNIKLQTVPVKHCTEAYGVVLEEESKWKMVYSGDSAPCQKLIDAGKDCTILIHEASIEDNLVNEAIAKKHSTPSQVIEIAQKMNAKYAITTHFSKRYLALPVLPDCKERHIAHAFDFMKIQACDWPVLPLFTPVIQALFQEQLQEHTEKSSSVVSFERTFLKILKS